MGSVYTLPKKKFKRDVKYERIRHEFFPGFDDKIWNLEDNEEKGWWTIPRTMPLILTLINMLDAEKKHDASRVYLDLWCRAFGAGIVEVLDEPTMAYSSNLISPRAVRSWHERIAFLERIEFIKTRGIGNRKVQYILLLHPHKVVASLRKQGKIPEMWYATFRQRMIQIGAELAEAQVVVKKSKKKIGG
jgi:hypothetical protein